MNRGLLQSVVLLCLAWPAFGATADAPRGREMQQAFNAALQSLPLRKLETEYFQRLEGHKGSAAQ